MEAQNRDLALAIEAAMDGIALLNARGEYTHMNKAHAAMLGCASSGELVGHSWREIYDADEEARIAGEVFTDLFANKSWTGTATAKRKDGTTFPQELSLSLLPTGGLVCICRDVTEKMKTATALRESETRWELAVQSISDGVWDADLSTGVMHLSEGWKALLGLSDEELVTSWAVLSQRVHPDDAHIPEQTAATGLSPQTQVFDAELRMRANDGSYRWLQARGRGLCDEAGKPVRMVGIATDISGRRQVFEQLLTNLAREKEFSEMRTEFISMASHELRTPMATLALSLDFLTTYRTELSSAQIEKSLANANVAASQLSAIIDDLLVLGRADQGRLKCELQRLNVSEQLAEIVRECRLQEGARTRIGISCEPTLEALLDPALLRHILLNLLSNACKYSDAARPVLLSAMETPQGVEIRVSDLGIGIHPDDRGRLFSLFFRGQNVGSVTGTGLGLVVVKHCVSAHGGTISYESTLGEGTCFTIVLPGA